MLQARHEAARHRPSILSAAFGRLAEEVRALDVAGADWIHVDVMDGRFVPDFSIGPVLVEAVRRAAAKPLNVHLMIVEPERYRDDFARSEADHILVHAEPHRRFTCTRCSAEFASSGTTVFGAPDYAAAVAQLRHCSSG